MSIRSLLVVLAFVALPGFAEPTADKRADIRKLLELTGTIGLGTSMSAALTERLETAIKAAHPDVPPKLLALIPEEVNAAVKEDMPKLIDATTAIFDKYYTAEEIDGLLEFYSSELGRKFLRVGDELRKEGAAAGQEWVKSLAANVKSRLDGRFKAEGFSL